MGNVFMRKSTYEGSIVRSHVLSPLMGHEGYFEKLPCACVVLFINESCVQMSFRVGPESGRRRL